MGDVIPLHARASVGSRAAKSAKNSAVTPAARARGSAQTADQASAGIFCLCHHLETARESRPISAASSSRVSQSSITSRNDETDMPISLRQTVLESQAIMSRASKRGVGQTVLMAENPTATGFKAKFISRTAMARENAGFTQEEMARALGINQSKYHKYESRSLMPHYLLLTFCVLAKVSMEWMYTAAVEVKPLASPKKKPRPKRAA